MYTVRKYGRLPALFTGTKAECEAYVKDECYGLDNIYLIVEEK